MLTNIDDGPCFCIRKMSVVPSQEVVEASGINRSEPVALSVVVPCRNERDHIETALRSILAQEAPAGGFEIIVADGMSDDGTRQILERLSATDRRLKVIDNPARITSRALNDGIGQARGQYVAIMGAHTRYAKDYLLRCVEMLEEHSEICCAGGPIVSEGKSLFGQAIAAAMSHPAGIGNAKHRFPNYEGYAEGACFPVFRKEIFNAIGLYDERLVRNQDDDFNYRVARAGRKIFISPKASCSYYVREDPLRLFFQYFEYGYWRVAVLRKHRSPASARQLIPIIFFVLMFVLFVAGLYLPGRWRLTAAALPLMYASILFLSGLGIAKRRGILVGLMFPVAAAIMHFAYAVGCVWGVINGRSVITTNTTCPVAL